MLVHDAENDEGSRANQVVKILEDDIRRGDALQEMRTKKVGDANDDSKLLWRYLHSGLYPEVFGALRRGIQRARLQSADGIIKVLDISDEAICLLIFDKKVRELLDLVRSENVRKRRVYELTREIADLEKQGVTPPQEKRDELEKLGAKPKKGRKKRKRDGDNDGDASIVGGGGDEGGSLELNSHKMVFAQYLKDVERMRKHENDMGWYRLAWETIKDEHGLGGEADGHLSDDDGSRASNGIQSPEGMDTTSFVSSWSFSLESGFHAV